MGCGIHPKWEAALLDREVEMEKVEMEKVEMSKKPRWGGAEAAVPPA